MTKKKDLKRLVRARQAKTGESYTAALAQIRPPRIETVPEATREAQAAGLRCRAFVSRRLRGESDLTALFVRLRELLEALGARACKTLVRGEPPERRIPAAIPGAVEARRFLAAVRGGTRGLSRDENLFALEWNGAVVVGGMSLLGKAPLLYLGRLDDLSLGGFELLAVSMIGIGR